MRDAIRCSTRKRCASRTNTIIRKLRQRNKPSKLILRVSFVPWHSFLTENGIYGEEQAKVHHTGGTHAKGVYEYTGDDGKLYRVNYHSNDGGFMPEGEHIPTPPPIPEAIARALKYVEEQHKANGDKPLFDHRGFRINYMTKDIKEQIKAIHLEEMPKELSDQILMLQHEVELAEEEELRELEEEQRQNALLV